MRIGSDTLEIEKYRPEPGSRRWELPAWTHPLAQGEFPLFIAANGNLFPIGTAFSVGRGIPFVVTAAHNIYEVFKHDARPQPTKG